MIFFPIYNSLLYHDLLQPFNPRSTTGRSRLNLYSLQCSPLFVFPRLLFVKKS